MSDTRETEFTLGFFGGRPNSLSTESTAFSQAGIVSANFKIRGGLRSSSIPLVVRGTAGSKPFRNYAFFRLTQVFHFYVRSKPIAARQELDRSVAKTRKSMGLVNDRQEKATAESWPKATPFHGQGGEAHHGCPPICTPMFLPGSFLVGRITIGSTNFQRIRMLQDVVLSTKTD